LNDDDAIEEERRLLYVAITRAKTYLYISMHNEGRNGGMSSFNRLSRFISEPRVMDKLAAQYSWYNEDEEAVLGDVARPRMNKEGLYRKLVDYFGDDDGESNF